MTKCYFVGGNYNMQMFADVNDAKRIIPVRNYTEDLTEIRNQGGCCHREELDNQPIFEGYLSPMWDNSMQCLRYETQEAYNVLSQ